MLFRVVGCARVSGDEEEDGVDDLEYEFNFNGMNRSEFDHGFGTESMINGHMGYGRGSDPDLSRVQPLPQVPLLTNGQMVLRASAKCNLLSAS